MILRGNKFLAFNQESTVFDDDNLMHFKLSVRKNPHVLIFFYSKCLYMYTIFKHVYVYC